MGYPRIFTINSSITIGELLSTSDTIIYMAFPRTQVTLCILIKVDEKGERQIGLAMKKRGFGAGRWNGMGGKVKEGETIEQAMIRETQEEVGVKVLDYQKVAHLHFYFSHEPTWNQSMHVYVATKWFGEPSESEEMKPAWFKINEIPYKEMWPDDIYWLPHVLEAKFVEASFTFAPGDKVLSKEVLLKSI